MSSNDEFNVQSPPCCVVKRTPILGASSKIKSKPHPSCYSNMREESTCLDDSVKEGKVMTEELKFTYDDADSYINEMSELYSYTENTERDRNLQAFKNLMHQYNMAAVWLPLSAEEKAGIAMKLVDQLEMSNALLRSKASWYVLYLLQGCWNETRTLDEQRECIRDNVMLFYKHGILASFVDLLNIELECDVVAYKNNTKSYFNESQNLRVILSVLYIMTEVMRNELKGPPGEYRDLATAFVDEVQSPIGHELIVVKLLDMILLVTVEPEKVLHYPVKKIILLIWKLILVSLGGKDKLKELKQKYRSEAGLPLYPQENIEVVDTMRASSPPKTLRRQILGIPNPPEELRERISFEGIECEGELSIYDIIDEPITPALESEHIRESKSDDKEAHSPTRLPWIPKVRAWDIEAFLQTSRKKYCGCEFSDDLKSTAGFPTPICDVIDVLNKYKYTSLSEVHLKTDIEMQYHPMLHENYAIPQTPTEMLYQSIHKKLPQYTIALLKIMINAFPFWTGFTSINICAEVLPDPKIDSTPEMEMEKARHKEIVMKAISAIFINLLKHFKLNHVYQFEYLSHSLTHSNGINIILKFFNREQLLGYVTRSCDNVRLNFPLSVIKSNTAITEPDYSWRNLFTSINLLRILNKITKWKEWRIKAMVACKSATILKKTLKLRNSMLQFYALKLLKMQMKYLGKKWRRLNMDTVGVIYSKVRHRLNDNWAYGTEAAFGDGEDRSYFHTMENELSHRIRYFNFRRYSDINSEEFWDDNDGVEVVADSLDEHFKKNYEKWLVHQVYNVPFDWDEFLASGSYMA